jgi:hypothetical protein
MIDHLPREEHASLLARIATWLRPGGLLLMTFDAAEAREAIATWFGVPMYFSGFDAAANLALVARAGLEVVRQEVEAQVEHGSDVHFLWVLARKPQ